MQISNVLDIARTIYRLKIYFRITALKANPSPGPSIRSFSMGMHLFELYISFNLPTNAQVNMNK